MFSIKWLQYQWPQVTLIVTNYSILKLLKSHTFENIAHTQDISVHVSDIESENSSRSQAVHAPWKWLIQTLLLQITSRKWYVDYQIAPFRMILGDRQDHSPTASIFKCNFSYNCAAVEKTSSSTEHCMVHRTALDHCHCHWLAVCLW